MDLLLLGGTAFLGRELATQAIARGWRVTCVARGESGDAPSGAAWVRADRDADDGLAEVAERRWDAVVDVTRHPGHVRRAVRDLRAGHFVFVSTGSVYADTGTVGLTEDGPLLEPLEGDRMPDMEAYGAAKVACEEAVRSLDQHTVARVGLIGGPGDWSGRSGYWPWRFVHPTGDRVLVPDDPDLRVQILDVRDLAGWLLDAAAERVDGTFNLTGATTTLDHVLRTSARIAGFTGEPARAAPDWLTDHEVAEWMGPRSLPLWLADPGWRGFGARDSARAEAAGLRRRPLAQTLADALVYELTRVEPRRAGLTDEEERELLAALAGP